ncbi:hypothetical protein TI04_01460 [Achromatium sp. WMS2]|nr:hypothetical protein TI04_01460 [Achromatium sp. WMS2]
MKLQQFLNFTWLLCIILGLGLTGCATRPPIDPPVPQPPVVPNPPPPTVVLPAPETYVVKRGDWLSTICQTYGLNIQDVANWNNIPPPYDRIQPGQVLRLRPGMASRPMERRRPEVEDSQVDEGPLPPDYQANDWMWPTDGQVVQTFVKGNHTRSGIRIAGTLNQNVVAAASGKVIYSGTGLPGYGKLIIIKHKKNYLSAYGFNNKLLVREGKWVNQGQTISKMGHSADRKPMLHFEIRRIGKVLNPLRLLPRR